MRAQNMKLFRVYARDNDIDITLEASVLDFLDVSPGSTLEQAVRWVS